jgi:Zn-dependent alcohol dehydrogenase
MKAAQISRPNGDWELVELDIPEPTAGKVRIKVEACGTRARWGSRPWRSAAGRTRRH